MVIGGTLNILQRSWRGGIQQARLLYVASLQLGSLGGVARRAVPGTFYALPLHLGAATPELNRAIAGGLRCSDWAARGKICHARFARRQPNTTPD